MQSSSLDTKIRRRSWSLRNRRGIEASGFFASRSNGACQFGRDDRYLRRADTRRYRCSSTRRTHARYTSYKSIREHWSAFVTDIPARNKLSDTHGDSPRTVAVLMLIAGDDRRRRKRFVNTDPLSRTDCFLNIIELIKLRRRLSFSVLLPYIRSGWANLAEWYTISAI